MMFFNHGFVVSAISRNKSQIRSSSRQSASLSSQQKKSTFFNWWWTLIIGALFVLAGFFCAIVTILLKNRKQGERFFEEVCTDIHNDWAEILFCMIVGLIYGLLPSGCHFFWRRSMLKNNHKHAKGWLIAFWVLVGIALAVVLGLWVLAFVNA